MGNVGGYVALGLPCKSNKLLASDLPERFTEVAFITQVCVHLGILNPLIS